MEEEDDVGSVKTSAGESLEEDVLMLLVVEGRFEEARSLVTEVSKQSETVAVYALSLAATEPNDAERL